MLDISIINSKELKIMLIRLSTQFGIKDTKPFTKLLFLKNHKKKIFLTNKTEKNFKLNLKRSEKAGIYFGTINKDESIRLSLEGSQIIGKVATKNILQLEHAQAESWLKGYDFDIPQLEDGYYLLKYKEDFLGCGLIKENKLHNFLPKTRRLKVLYE
jgi:NOL1/NOP2/fmu family ribosome biogenesis protein